MPKPSNRGQYAFESPIRKLTPYADQAKSQGVQVFHLNIGQPDIHSPSSALESIRQYSEPLIAYGASEGFLPYREGLVEYYSKWGIHHLTTDDIMITTGASEALLFVLLASCDPGDEIIIPEPFYANYNGMCEMAQVKVVPITTSLDQQFAIPSREEFEQALTPRTKGFLLCNPNNPTGKVYDQATLEGLAQIIKANDLYLIVDEVYREFCYENSFYSALRLQEIEGQTVVVDSISKRYSACGARVGAVVTKIAALRKNMLKYAQLRLCPPMIAQYFALHTLDAEDCYFEEVREEYNSRREYVMARLSQMPGVSFSPPEGAFYVFARLPVGDAEDFAKWMLSEFRHEGATVMIAPAAGFYATPGLGQDEVRIAYVLREEALAKAMDCLEEGLKVYSKQKNILTAMMELS